MEHEHTMAQNTTGKTVLGPRTFIDDDETCIRSGAPSREGRTRRKAWAQNHGSGLVSDSRVAEGTESQGATSTLEYSGQSDVARILPSPVKEMRYG